MTRNNLITIFSVAFTLDYRFWGNLNEISLSIAYVSLRYLTNIITVENQKCT